MALYNKEKMTELDYRLLLEKYGDTSLLKEALKKIDDDYPVQYLIGNVDFLGCPILVDERVLIPRFETELLAEKLIKYIREKSLDKAKVLDLCTGSGCIAVSVKSRCKDTLMWAVDKSLDALEVAKENAKLNGVEIFFLEGDVLKSELPDEVFDVIVANPPYVLKDEIVSANTKFEPQIALYPGKDDIVFYKKILEYAEGHVREKSLIVFEIGSTQAERISNYARQFFPKSHILIQKDYAGLDRFIFIFNYFE